MAFGGLRSSCVCPGAHYALRQDSRKDLTPCRMACISSPPALTRRTPTKRSALRLVRRTPLVADAPSLSLLLHCLYTEGMFHLRESLRNPWI